LYAGKLYSKPLGENDLERILCNNDGPHTALTKVTVVFLVVYRRGVDVVVICLSETLFVVVFPWMLEKKKRITQEWADV
jgi:hypothetical protein